MGLSKSERMEMLKKWKKYKKNEEYGERSGYLKSKSVLIFDMMYMFKSHFVANRAQSERGVPIGGVKGALDKIYWLTKKFNAKTVVCVFDGKDSHDKRQSIYEDYKSNRNKSNDGLKSVFDLPKDKNEHNKKYQMNLLVKILQELPVKLVIHKRLEADDIIGYLTKQYYGDVGGVRIIVSRDKDFYQLIDPNTAIYNPTDDELITSKNLRKHWDTYPQNIIYYRCIEGDASDNVEGISGVGTKTIEKYLPELHDRKFESIDEFIELIESKEEEFKRLKTTQKISEGIDVIRRNYEVCQLSEVDLGMDEKNTILSAMKSNEYDYRGKYKLQELVKKERVEKALRYDRLQEFYNIIRLQ